MREQPDGLVIWKMRLSGMTGAQQISVPNDCMILDVLEQHGELQMWAAVDPLAPYTFVTVHTFFTGDKVPMTVLENAEYLGTVLRSSGLVYHVWVEVP